MKKILLSVLASAALLLVGSNVTTVDVATTENNVSALTDILNKVVVKVTNPNGGRIYESKDGKLSLTNSRIVGYNTQWVGISSYLVSDGNVLLQWDEISTTDYVLAANVTVVGMA